MTEQLMTPRERALVDHAWSCASRHGTKEKFRSFLRKFYREGDSPALQNGLRALLDDYEVFYG